MSYQSSFPSGVVNTLTCHEIIDFTGFSGTFQHSAVADEKYFYHILIIFFIVLQN